MYADLDTSKIGGAADAHLRVSRARSESNHHLEGIVIYKVFFLSYVRHGATVSQRIRGY